MNDHLNKLLETMAHLRHPLKGCPWDIEQSFESLTRYTIEEAYEVADTIEQGDYEHLKEELGDLLFQVVFYAQIADEKNLFNFYDVVEKINTKMIHRHPHVFEKNHPKITISEQNKAWESNKLKNKNSVLDDVPENLPGLLRAVKLAKRAAVIGFDWPNIEPVFEKMQEELQELKEAIKSGDQNSIKDELGDVLFVCTNLARNLNVDPELAMRHANTKFENRFRDVEKLAKSEHPQLLSYDLDYLDRLWNEVKKKNRKLKQQNET
ncbi:MAG: nucleoside triphosphate pyrophosphohydrolase [Marinicellaceae bacterium]